MRFGIAGCFLFVCALVFAGPAKAAVFCDADIAAAGPWNAATGLPAESGVSTRYVLMLSANGAQRLSGDVTLLTDDTAYTVRFDNLTAVQSPLEPGAYYTNPIFVRFKQALTVRFGWVDDIAINGAATHSCPTFPYDVQYGRGTSPALGLPGDPKAQAALPEVGAQFRMALPPLDCKEPYAVAGAVMPQKTEETPVFDTTHGLKSNAVVRVFIDSNGKLVDRKIKKSSGSPAVDAVALDAVLEGRYTPEIFRCVPVVSQMDVTIDYEVKP